MKLQQAQYVGPKSVINAPLRDRNPGADGQCRMGGGSVGGAKAAGQGAVMERCEALALAERIKRRTRDLEVLALFVEGERVNAAPFRRPDDVTSTYVASTYVASTICPDCAVRRTAATARQRRWRHGRRAPR
jgi:hypothetical protein